MLQQYASTLTLILAIAFLYSFLYMLRKFRPNILSRWGISLEGLVIMFRTEKFNKFIENIGLKYERVITIVSYLAIIVGIYLLAVGVYFIHFNLLAILFKSSAASPVAPVLPGINIGLESLPYFVVAAAVVLIPHEFSHGILASAFKVPIKSSGLLLAVVLFGGFVEPDEDQLEKIPFLKKIGVFSAGSFANFLSFIVLILLFSNLMIASGVSVTRTLEGYPANDVLKAGDIIIKMNDTDVKNLQDLIRFMDNTKPGNSIKLLVVRNGKFVNVNIKLTEDPRNSSRGFMGASFNDFYKLALFSNSYSDLARVLSIEAYKVFIWSVMATQSIAIINMLPIYPFDGGRVVDVVVGKLVRDDKKRMIIKIAISLYFAAVLISNMVLSISLWGFKIWLP